MNEIYIANETKLQEVIGDIRETFRKHGRVRIRFSHEKRRSDDQNALSHAWYAQVSRELREDSPEGVHRFCKLHFGVPILRADDVDFREMYDTAIRTHLSYEQKLKAMDFLPVTRLMSTDQLSRYLEEVQAHYANKVRLEFPEVA